MTHINGTAIKFVKPFHIAGAAPNVMIAAAGAPAVADPKAALRYVPRGVTTLRSCQVR